MLFEKNPDKRLGGGPQGSEEVKQHHWFKSVNWQDIYEKKVAPFFTPHIDNDQDVSHFDEIFVNEPINSFSTSQPGTSNQLYPGRPSLPSPP